MKYTFYQLAYDILENADKPLTIDEIWDKAVELGLVDKLGSCGRMPKVTLTARIYLEAGKEEDPTIIKVSDKPSKFILNRGENVFEILDEEVVEPKEKKEQS